jgi:D-amino-acid oxidase
MTGVRHQARIAVVGAGIAGLSVARRLLAGGYGEVVIYYDAATSQTASYVAAGLVEPIAGSSDPDGLALDLELFERSYPMWAGTSAVNPLVARRTVTAYTRGRVEPFPWHRSVKGYRELRQRELHPAYRDAEAASFSSFAVDTRQWLAQSRLQLGRRGAKFVKRHVSSFDELTGFDAIVNATGLGAHRLAGDPTLERKDGHVVYLRRPVGLDEVFMEERRSDEAIARDPLGVNMAYSIPRVHDVVVGGTLFPEDDLARRPDPVPLMAQRLVEMMSEIEPRLRGPRVLGYRVGSRPSRAAGVRLEIDTDYTAVPLVHCYGFGGSGWTLSPGAAEVVVDLLGVALFGRRRRASRAHGQGLAVGM